MGVSFGPIGLSATVSGFNHPIVAWASLPAAESVGQIYEITDFGIPYVQVQWNGSAWKQKTQFSCTWETLPSATTFLGFKGNVNNFFGGFDVIARAAAGSNYWRPQRDVHLIRYLAVDPPVTYGPDSPVVNYTLASNIALPNSGFILVGDYISIDNLTQRGGTLVTEGAKVSARIGTSATPTDNPAVVISSTTGTSIQTRRAIQTAIITTTTKAVQIAEGNAGVGTSASTRAERVITNITTADQFISLTLVAAGVLETSTPIWVNCYLTPFA